MALYAFNRREDENLAQAETELMFSIGKSYDLYHYLLLLVLEIADIAGEKIDLALQKRMPSHEDLNPRRRFIDNQLIAQLRKNIEFKKYISTKKLSWVNNSHIPRLLYNKMIVWEVYEEYMNSETIIISLIKNSLSGLSLICFQIRKIFIQILKNRASTGMMIWNIYHPWLKKP